LTAPLRRFIAAKLHNLHVNGKAVTYSGSVSIDAGLMTAVGIRPYEEAQVVNLANGQRWTTYVIPAGPGVFTLNGGSARLGEIGDPCVVMTYVLAVEAPGADVLHLTPDNTVRETLTYPTGRP
jgi:aspartate 1-decarboxylase